MAIVLVIRSFLRPEFLKKLFLNEILFNIGRFTTLERKFQVAE